MDIQYSWIEMIIAIAGVPGTGKSATAEALSKLLKTSVIKTTEIVERNAVRYEMDELRGVKIVEPEELQRAVNQYVKYNSIIEGMLSHLLHADIVIVLRCNPEKLTKRMKEKGWNDAKIRENIEAEMIDTVTIEALQKHPTEKIREIDTSDITPERTAEIIERILKGHDKEHHKAGSIDWTRKYMEYLVG